MTMKVLRGSCWATRPPGLVIYAMPDGVSVETGGRQLLGLRMQRPERLVLIDEVIVSLPHPTLPPPTRQETKMTPAEARAFCLDAQFKTPAGLLRIGDELAAALDEHARLFREELGRGPALVAPVDLS